MEVIFNFHKNLINQIDTFLCGFVDGYDRYDILVNLKLKSKALIRPSCFKC